MSLIKHTPKPYALLICSLALTACGGGGGGSSSSFTAEKPITITEANTPQVIAEGTEAAVDSELSSSLSSPLSTALRSGDSNNQVSGYAQSFSRNVRLLVDSSLDNLSVRSRTAEVTSTVDCELSGSLTVSVSGDVNENTGNGSFSGSISANDCINGDGEEIDGSFTVSGNLEDSEISGSLTASFDEFSVRSPEGSGFIDGSMIISVVETGGYEEFRLVSRGAAFSFTEGGKTVTIGEFNLVSRDYGLYTDASLNFTANSSRLGGSYQFDTVEDFRTDSSQDYPYEGQAVITGENNGKIRITPQGSGEPSGLVLIETDLDGNGYVTFDTLTWAEIDDD